MFHHGITKITNIYSMEKGSSFYSLVTLIFLNLLLAGLATSLTHNITTDQLALLSLKTRITSDPYGSLENWNFSFPVCNWTGVTCGSPRHHRVTALNVSNMELAGDIPPQLGNLSFLFSLDMKNNSFTGLVPQELSHLPRLRFLGLSYNLLVGSIPQTIFNLSTLETISLVNNTLSGILPNDMCLGLPLLKELYLSYNEIHGRIPSTFAAYCPQLRILALAANKFCGNIPPEIGSLGMLEELYLGGNTLSGTIPAEIGQLGRLRSLNMERNMLTGSIPYTLFNLSSLQFLRLFQNELDGMLREEFGNFTMLVLVDLALNNFTGVIPQRLGQLSELEFLSLSFNTLSGFIHSDTWNISTLTSISVTSNNLSGRLPSNMCDSLPNLEYLYIAGNEFNGVLPISITNCSKLMVVEVAENRFMGPIPNTLGDLRQLQLLSMFGNNFTSQLRSPELSFLTSLTSCRYLTYLSVGHNHLNGNLPRSFGNLSSSLELISIPESGISGHIPSAIGNLSGLVSLSLAGNNLGGVIPFTMGRLQNLQRLVLPSNKLRGLIPHSLCGLENLGLLNLNENQLKGPIPECVGNLSSSRYLRLNSNYFNSSIPENIWDLTHLLYLDISSNSLSGSLSPQIGNLNAITYINLSLNNLSGDIPNTFQGLASLINFSLAHNKFQGPLPNYMSGMLDLAELDLSYNNLSGAIPKSLEALRHLEYFNVSFNQLSGEIPSGGPFVNFTSQSFMSNYALCGLPRYQVSQCNDKKSKLEITKRYRLLLIILPITVAVLSGIIFLIAVRRGRKNEPQTASAVSLIGELPRLSYYEVLKSTNGLSDENLLGRGSFGSVYKGVFTDGTVFAIKVFNEKLEGASKTFDVECEMLRNLRHRNLTGVISSCTNLDFRALVLEYMPNGSLDKWLYSKEDTLSLLQRLSIIIDVASALEYLHHGYTTPVVHCDLKPSNVLLDENMIAHLTDFGIAKLLGIGESVIHTRTLATIGYMAPEYGMDGRISTRCDVYSYGIMVLETFTGKQPSDALFSGDLNLKNWVKNTWRDGLSQVIDANVITPEDEHFKEKMHCVSSVLEIALRCSEDSAIERMLVKDVVTELNKVKNQLSALLPMSK